VTPDDTTPDTAMATGNDEGEPGGHRDGGPLTPDERRFLDRLTDPDDDAPAQPAVEDSPEAAAAADDEAPLPRPAADVGDQGDELAPEFTDS
jgi:hypothetical protein